MAPRFLLAAAAACAAAAAASTAALRPVDCSAASLPVDASLLSLYQAFAFGGFEDTPSRQGKSTLAFESLVALAGAAGGAVDVAEFLVTAAAIARNVTNASVPIPAVVDTWRAAWVGVGSTALADAEAAASAGRRRSAASAYMRAWTYLSIAERFDDHLNPDALALYADAVRAFERGAALGGAGGCTPVDVPYLPATAGAGAANNYSLHGYWCPAAAPAAAPATVVAMTGYDGTAEMTVLSVALPANAAGFNVLIFEGPGQGSTVRTQGLTFVPQWETVVEQVVAWAASDALGPTAGFNAARVVLWGRSFGGYLAPRAFAAQSAALPPYLALVADGGVLDFFQTLVCALPPSLQSLLYSNLTAFTGALDGAAQYSLSVRFLLGYGALGFGAADAGALYTTLQAYALTDGVLAGVGARPVLVNNPVLDNLVGNQSSLFFTALPAPAAPATRLQRLDPMRGAGLHCGVGSTSYSPDAILDWLADALPAPASTPSSSASQHPGRGRGE